MSRGAARGWAAGPRSPTATSPARTRRGAAARPGPRARRSLRRRAAAIRGFYRFAYGDGLIAVDVAAHLDLPRQPRLLPETLTVDEVERLLEAAGGIPDAPGGASDGARRTRTGVALRDRALPRAALRRRAARVARRSGSTARTSSLDEAFVRVIGKGDKERRRAGRRRRARLAGALPRMAAGRLAGGRPGRRTGPARRCSSTQRGRRLGRQAGLVGGQGGRPTRPDLGDRVVAAHAAPLVRDAPARGRGRPARRPGVARTCEYLRRPSSTRISPGNGSARSTPAPIRGPEEAEGEP